MSVKVNFYCDFFAKILSLKFLKKSSFIWVEINISYIYSKKKYREDPRWQQGCRSRQHELHESKPLLRHWSHAWQK
jgi:hypothetical protein